MSRFEKLAEEVRAERRRAAMMQRMSMGQAPPGRNDPCPCGSGRKFKKCCGRRA
jgi:uncharacterized protein YecA (UPF0149 family)